MIGTVTQGTLLGISISHIRVPYFWCLAPIHVPISPGAHTEKQQMMAQVIECLSSTWKSQIVVSAPGLIWPNLDFYKYLGSKSTNKRFQTLNSHWDTMDASDRSYYSRLCRVFLTPGMWNFLLDNKTEQRRKSRWCAQYKSYRESGHLIPLNLCPSCSSFSTLSAS